MPIHRPTLLFGFWGVREYNILNLPSQYQDLKEEKVNTSNLPDPSSGEWSNGVPAVIVPN
jgi:hypothetical protein